MKNWSLPGVLFVFFTISTAMAKLGGVSPGSVTDNNVIAAAAFAVTAQEKAMQNKDDPKLPVPKTSTNIINFVLSTVTLGTNITSSVVSEPNTPGISWAGQMFSRASSLVAAGANFSKPPTTLYIQSFAAGFGLYAIGFSSGVALSKIDDDPDFGTFE